jgi:hypothetical protein
LHGTGFRAHGSHARSRKPTGMRLAHRSMWV